MSEDNDRQRPFIKETIVPRKKFKKIMLIVASVLSLAIVFGLVAGVVSVITRSVIGDTDVGPMLETIVIARDETVTAETTARASVPESRSAADSNTPDSDPGTKEEGHESYGTSSEDTDPDGAESENSSVEIDPDAVLLAENTAKKIRDDASDAFVTVHVYSGGATDWFDTVIESLTETFGVICARSEEYYYVLADGARVPSGEVSVSLTSEGGETVAAEVYGRDTITGLCILRAVRAEFKEELPALTLGNSFTLTPGDTIYMLGAPYGKPGAFAAGMVTYVDDFCDRTDGYEQYLYTNLLRSDDGCAVLLNKEGSVVGWVSDYSCIDAENMVIACGISPLKYLIEDMCSGTDSAYLGVNCLTVGATDAGILGVPTGLYVQEVIAGSPAQEAGIQPGDRIVSINGRTVEDGHTLQIRIDELGQDPTVPVEIERRGVSGYEPMTLMITFGRR